VPIIVDLGGALGADPGATGRPFAYAQYAKKLVLYPTPDAAYPVEIRYRGRPATLVDDGDTVDIPDAYVDALVAWVRYKLFRSEDDIQAAQYWRGEFESSVAEARADMQRRDVSKVSRVPSMWEQEARGPSFTMPA
jgi:hypothetical protein